MAWGSDEHQVAIVARFLSPACLRMPGEGAVGAGGDTVYVPGEDFTMMAAGDMSFFVFTLMT